MDWDGGQARASGGRSSSLHDGKVPNVGSRRGTRRGDERGSEPAGGTRVSPWRRWSVDGYSEGVYVGAGASRGPANAPIFEFTIDQTSTKNDWVSYFLRRRGRRRRSRLTGVQSSTTGVGASRRRRRRKYRIRRRAMRFGITSMLQYTENTARTLVAPTVPDLIASTPSTRTPAPRRRSR